MGQALNPLTSTQRQMRDALLSRCDLANAGAAANQLTERMLNELNDLGREDSAIPLHSASSLVTRAIIARALLATAAYWWTDLMPGLDRADTMRVLADLILNGVPGLRDHIIDDRELTSQ